MRETKWLVYDFINLYYLSHSAKEGRDCRIRSPSNSVTCREHTLNVRFNVWWIRGILWEVNDVSSWCWMRAWLVVRYLIGDMWEATYSNIIDRSLQTMLPSKSRGISGWIVVNLWFPISFVQFCVWVECSSWKFTYLLKAFSDICQSNKIT